ncbi:peptidoglycan-binding protein [Streptomyces sp. NPDC059785]|uniref:peptidoglycan-binding protein n=1 Tax=unclassified Streptomyces TaxID=2593676 RepID=UPI00364C46A6
MSGFFFPFPEDTPSGRREWLAHLRERVLSVDSKNEVLDVIDSALAVNAPDGSEGALEVVSQRYSGRVGDVDDVFDRVDRVARKGLPEVWVGDTSVLATDAVNAAGRAVTHMSETFTKGAKVLLTLGDALGEAQRLDEKGRGQLREQKTALGGRDGFFDDLHENDEEEWDRKNAAHFAAFGLDDMHKAAADAEEAARVAARELNKLASEARTGKMKTKELTAVDKLMLADTAVAGTATELNEILSADDMQRASQRLDGLNAKDERAVEKMLAGASSPQERAYLMKALAAGHSVADIEKFRSKIHGKDPDWLRAHLTPVVTASDSMNDEGLAEDGSNNNKDFMAFDGQGWSQGGDGSEGTCVASSTVTARAMVDPLYALDLTGGPSGQENDGDAFRERLVAEQHRLHEEGDGGDGWNGMDLEGKERIVDSTIGSATGDDYERHDVSSADDRRAALNDIEKAVADGKPVPIGVEGKNEDGDRVGHAMTIIGQEGDMLQIYNPWGTTTWVSEDDFINGHMNKASDKDLPNAYSVLLPE